MKPAIERSQCLNKYNKYCDTEDAISEIRKYHILVQEKHMRQQSGITKYLRKLKDNLGAEIAAQKDSPVIYGL